MVKITQHLRLQSLLFLLLFFSQEEAGPRRHGLSVAAEGQKELLGSASWNSGPWRFGASTNAACKGIALLF